MIVDFIINLQSYIFHTKLLQVYSLCSGIFNCIISLHFFFVFFTCIIKFHNLLTINNYECLFLIDKHY